MKTLSILLLSCAAKCFADEVTPICTTQDSGGHTIMTETYVRDGQTNLVRHTDIPSQGQTIRSHFLFHGGELVGCVVNGTNSSGCITEPGSPYMLSFSSGASNELRAIIVGNKKGQVVDAFGCTNGVISPVSTSILREARSVNMRQYMIPENIRRAVWNEPYSAN